MVGSTWGVYYYFSSFVIFPHFSFCNNCLVDYSVTTVGLYTVLSYNVIQNITTTAR